MTDKLSLQQVNKYLTMYTNGINFDNDALQLIQSYLAVIFTELWKDVKSSSDIVNNFLTVHNNDTTNTIYIELNKKLNSAPESTDLFAAIIDMEIELYIKSIADVLMHERRLQNNIIKGNCSKSKAKKSRNFTTKDVTNEYYREVIARNPKLVNLVK